MRRLTCALTAMAGLLLTAACAAPAQGRTATGAPAPSSTSTPSADCTGFALSIASDHGGQPSPQAAAAWSVRHGPATGYPSSGWRQIGHDEIGVTLSSGGATLHVVQVPDQTWFVDTGHRC